MITKEQITFKNVKAFIQGYYRYYMYTWFKTKLLREHIVSQYQTRLNSVDKKCLNDGQCKLCGCAVPQSDIGPFRKKRLRCRRGQRRQTGRADKG